MHIRHIIKRIIMNYKITAIMALSVLFISACAPTDYINKNPSSLSSEDQLFGYNQAVENNNGSRTIAFINYFKSKLSPDDYLLFAYLSSPGLGITTTSHYRDNVLFGPEAKLITVRSSPILINSEDKLAMEAKKYKLFGGNAVYCGAMINNQDFCRSEVAVNNIALNPRTTNIAISLAKNGDPIACRFLYIERPSENTLGSDEAKSLTVCANKGIDSRNLNFYLKNYRYMVIDNKYDNFFYSHTHTKELIQKLREQAEKSCSGVVIPNKISDHLIMRSTSHDRNFYSSRIYADLTDWKRITYRNWLGSEANHEVNNITQYGLPISIQTTPIVAKDVCEQIKLMESN